MKSILKLLLIAVVQALYGCAASPVIPIETPTGKMWHGDPSPLLEQVKAGAIGINDWQAAYVYESAESPLVLSIGWTPLCAAIAADDINSVSTLLQLGASVSQPCGMKRDEINKNPLEFTMLLTGQKPKAEQIARLLIANGAVTRTGKVSEAEIQNSKVQNVAIYNKLVETSVANAAQIMKEITDKKEAKEAAAKEGFFNRDTVMGLVAIAGATTNNYAAITHQQQAAASLGNNILVDSQRAADSAREANVRRAREAQQQQTIQKANGSAPQKPAQQVRSNSNKSSAIVADASSASSSSSNLANTFTTPLRAASPPSVNTRTDPTGSTAPTRQPPKVAWGPIQLEALAICREVQKNKWWCDGPTQEILVSDYPTVQDALGTVGCISPTSAAGGTTKNGKEGDVYRCGFGLPSYKRNIAKIHNLVTAQRSYMCPASQAADCTIFYDGQDKR